ncbi:acetate/propionate family kinase [Pedobacter sp. N36a]|uniref:acetate/propionate family kinase n=1 Tax=Pedobacter sp. N36a TaxID=2767996 RepID=UPI00165741F3|nr:acetate/propionate family kinase [Pedobacter sp. N36a]MBC8988048.1 acetate/propionate family kinase [Pedobacter sp. N36a]
MHHSNTISAYILVLNSGSSSLKFSLYHQHSLELEWSGSITGIGDKQAKLLISDPAGKLLLSKKASYLNLEIAAAELINRLDSLSARFPIQHIGYRLVQGGPMHRMPEVINEDLIKVLESYTYLAPNHLPKEIQLIRIFQQSYQKAIHIACFDTYFHQNMPAVAKFYALPRAFRDQGLMRYGFHGLSYEYIIQELGSKTKDIEEKKIIIAHLGNGASMAAVSGGIGQETTMGMSPIGGLVMSTRSGDLDPGVSLFFLRKFQMTLAQLDELFSNSSGLKAIAGTGNMEELIHKRSADPQAQEAIDVFCYQAKRQIAALAAGLGGLDILIFTGGIGENAPLIREHICRDMLFMGIKLDPDLNQNSENIISTLDSTVSIQVIKTNEAWMIAKHIDHLTNTNLKN